MVVRGGQLFEAAAAAAATGRKWKFDFLWWKD